MKIIIMVTVGSGSDKRHEPEFENSQSEGE